jgi:hypothetical protein
MATKLNKPVTRVVEIKDVNGVEGDVAVTMTASGLAFSKGRRKFAQVPWSNMGKLLTLPMNIPAKYAANPFGWLVELSQK